MCIQSGSRAVRPENPGIRRHVRTSGSAESVRNLESSAPDCPSRCFLMVTDEVIRCHLSGRTEQGQEFVMGVYPMLLDETCYFLAIDFDGENWQDDTGAFLETCSRLDLPAALERSRSGNGRHVWIFFEQAIPASLARKLG